MQVRVLGPLELVSGSRAIHLGAPKQRAVLGLLLARAGTVVSVEQLVEELWADSPPASASANLRMYGANLRRLLAGLPDAPTVHRRGAGWTLTVEPATVDLHRFRELVRQARALVDADDPDRAVRLFEAARGLWRGAPVADLPAGRLLASWRTALEEERIQALEEHATALFRTEAFERAALLASELLSVQPLRERAHGLLVRCRYQTGDVAGALAALDTVRRGLAEHLGLELGEELRQLQRIILNRQPLPDSQAAPVVAGPLSVPRQLPADLAAFTGREPALRALDEALDLATGGSNAALLTGPAGVGKTALAVHWAHRVAKRFPDGQLHLNLRGFEPGPAPVPPGEAVRRLLHALGVPARSAPPGVEEQSALYRSLLAERRVLVVLDNARDAGQVRPLLPGASGGFVLVTSRDELTSLVTIEAVRPVRLELLSPAEGRELLARRIGADRVAAGGSAVDEILTGCSGLPLALAIVAARAAARPTFPLGAFAAELRDAETRLDAFSGTDEATDVRAVFSWSYLALTPPAARLFRMHGLHPGPHLSTAAAASLVGLPLARTRPLLAELTRAHLLTEPTPGRFTCHDLLRTYAAELAVGTDPEADRQAAAARLLDHYLYTARLAEQTVNPYTAADPGDPPAGVVGEQLPDTAAAVAWFTREYPVLLAAIRWAGANGQEDQCWRLAVAMADFLTRQGHWLDQAAVQRIALDAARRSGHRPGQAESYRLLARTRGLLGETEAAHRYFLRALGVFAELDDSAGQALTHRNLAWLLDRQGRVGESLWHNQRALSLYRLAGHRLGQARALNAVGWGYARFGEHARTLAYCQQAVELLAEVGDRLGEGFAWDSLGYAHHRLGDQQRAISCFRRALRLFDAGGGDRYNEAEVLTHLGDAQCEAGDQDAARDSWGRALSRLDRLGHPDAARVRGRLARSDAATTDLAGTDAQAGVSPETGGPAGGSPEAGTSTSGSSGDVGGRG